MVIKKLEKILQKSTKYIAISTPDTFFDIIGYGHYENINSNILAYFISSQNGHNFYKYFIDSIFEILDINDRSYSYIKTYREYPTIKGGRLDIIIETDNILIGIENKVYHHLNNDLKDYEDTLKQKDKNKEVCLSILALYSLESEYKTFTHLELWEKIFNKIDFTEHMLDKNMIILNDVKENITKLTKGQQMDESTIKFLQDNTVEIKHIIKLLQDFDNQQKGKFNFLKNELANKNYFKQNNLVRIQCKDAPIDDFVYYSVLNIKDKEIVIDIVLSSKNENNNYQIIIYQHKENKREITDELSKLLDSKNITFENIIYDNCKRALLFETNDIKDVSPNIIEIAKKLIN